MAQQESFLKLKGNVGDISFYKSKNGFGTRQRGGVDGSRIESDPRFQRTRENGAEFRRAIAASKMLKAAFRPLLRKTADGKMWNRLTREFMRVVKADSSSLRGERNVMMGACELLERFEFNTEAPFGTIFITPITTQVDREQGKHKITIPPFIPRDMVTAPQGATHFRIISAAAEFDFDREESTIVQDVQQEIDVNTMTPTAAVQVFHQLTAESTLPVFIVVGIEFVQLVNGISYPLTNGFYNSLALVKVDQL